MSFFSSLSVILSFLSKRFRHFRALPQICSPVSISKRCLRSAARSVFQSTVSDLQPGQYFKALFQICSPVSISKYCLRFAARSVFSIPVSDMNPCQHSEFFPEKDIPVCSSQLFCREVRFRTWYLTITERKKAHTAINNPIHGAVAGSSPVSIARCCSETGYHGVFKCALYPARQLNWLSN